MSLFDGLGPVVRSIEHIGSTAVPGIRAKPVIDILVIGATGFLGGHLIEEMVKGPHAPVCAHRKGSDTEKIDALGVEKTVFDLTDLDPMLQALKGVHAVVHLTAYYTFTGEKEMHDRVNVKGNRGPSRSVQGGGLRALPVPQQHRGHGADGVPPGDGGSPLDRQYGYGRPKARAEKLVRTSGLDRTILRPSGI
jgi:uncharacterized protein YbjT (DUF2867 family)